MERCYLQHGISRSRHSALAGFIPARRADFRQSDVVRALREYSMFGHNIRMEFNGSVEEIVDLAYSERPNKIALAVEFEQIRSALGRGPDKVRY